MSTRVPPPGAARPVALVLAAAWPPWPTSLVSAACAASMLVLVLAAPAQAGAPPDGTALLERAITSARLTPHSGEVLWVVSEGGTDHVRTTRVTGQGSDVTVRSDDSPTLHLSAGGGGLVDHAGAWFVPLPAADRAGSGDLVRLTEKYTVELAGRERLLNRPTTLLELRLRGTGDLRERLWVDDRTGLLLRRETLAGGEVLRMALYTSLDLGDEEPAPSSAPLPLVALQRGVQRVEARGRDALRSAGWVVPERLPGSYHAEGTYAVSGAEGQPLQLVFTDGLYTVSIFQQRGRLDEASLPEGGQRVDSGAGAVWSWPGAVPSRTVWEADGTTFALVGDAPPGELEAIAAALPAPAGPGVGERVRTGLSRLWAWVTPF